MRRRIGLLKQFVRNPCEMLSRFRESSPPDESVRPADFWSAYASSQCESGPLCP